MKISSKYSLVGFVGFLSIVPGLTGCKLVERFLDHHPDSGVVVDGGVDSGIMTDTGDGEPDAEVVEDAGATEPVDIVVTE